jgi:hypothetical protein
VAGHSLGGTVAPRVAAAEPPVAGLDTSGWWPVTAWRSEPGSATAAPTCGRSRRTDWAARSPSRCTSATGWPLDRYRGPVSSQRVPSEVVHKLPADLRKALIANPTALDAWKDVTPLARNEFICRVEDAKQEMTRERRIRRTQEELKEGQRRPCC